MNINKPPHYVHNPEGLQESWNDWHRRRKSALSQSDTKKRDKKLSALDDERWDLLRECRRSGDLAWWNPSKEDEEYGFWLWYYDEAGESWGNEVQVGGGHRTLPTEALWLKLIEIEHHLATMAAAVLEDAIKPEISRLFEAQHIYWQKRGIQEIKSLLGKTTTQDPMTINAIVAEALDVGFWQAMFFCRNDPDAARGRLQLEYVKLGGETVSENARLQAKAIQAVSDEILNTDGFKSIESHCNKIRDFFIKHPERIADCKKTTDRYGNEKGGPSRSTIRRAIKGRIPSKPKP